MKKKLIAGGLLLCTLALSACQTEKKQEKTEKAKTTAEKSTEAKVLSKYKEIKINGAKKTVQIGDPSKGETVAIVKVKGYGTMKFKFFLKDSPLAVKNFLTLASNGYYDGIIFHRVIKDFMIQGGDPTGTGKGGQSIWGKEFKNETSDKLIPVRGALCMANAGPDTNGSQFFVVQNREVTDEMLDSSPIELTKAQRDLFKEQGGYPSLTGDYTVFGQLYDGYDVLDKIAQTETVSDAKAENKPKKDIVIEKITVKNY